MKAQQFLVKEIPANSRILIVGGGTGWVLEEIAKIHANGLTITYVDSSAKMIALARARNVAGNIVTFIAAPIEETAPAEVYDVVLTPFLFDNFTDHVMQKVFVQLHERLAPQGIWLFCDFQKPIVFWQKILLKVMYLFFKVSCGIEASALPDTEGCFARHGYKIRAQETFVKGFVVSRVYEKCERE
jgi:ubiquinone/menaquinone biosynthesis C-methylase UbiE